MNKKLGVLFGEWFEIKIIFDENNKYIVDYVVENDCRNFVILMFDLKGIKVCIELGVIICDYVEIGDNVVIMMNVIINIGVVIGEGFMIDMNVVFGGCVIVGKNCYVGVGVVFVGVIELFFVKLVIVEDDVVIGVNVVVLEGVIVGKGVVVVVGVVVIEDVFLYIVVVGILVCVIKEIDEKIKVKIEIK